MATGGKYVIPTLDDVESEQPSTSMSLTSRSEVQIRTDVAQSSSQLASNQKSAQPATSRTSSDDITEVDPRPALESVAESSSAVHKPAKSSGAILASQKQRGNPILKHIRNIAIEYSDIVPDYEINQKSCILYLSIRYHNLNPNYIHERLKQLGHAYELRVLLTQVDVKDPSHALKELGQMCILADCTLILAFSHLEAARYIETYKSYENKPPDLIMEKTEDDYSSQVTEFLTSMKHVNKTDAMTLIKNFGSIKGICLATIEELSFCPGIGLLKATSIYNALREPFIKPKYAKSKKS